MIGLVALLGLLGCNPCLDVCDEMAAFAEDECGFTVSSDDVSACKERAEIADPSDAAKDACVTSGELDEIREWWTCEDLASNASGLSAR